MYNYYLGQNLETPRFVKFTLEVYTIYNRQTSMTLAGIVLLIFYHFCKFYMFICFSAAFCQSLMVQNLSNRITNSCRGKVFKGQTA